MAYLSIAADLDTDMDAISFSISKIARKVKLTNPTPVQVNPEEWPDTFRFLQCYPNPLNPSTTNSLSLPKTDWVAINIYNSAGQKIKIPVNKHYTAGNHRIEFDASEFAAGIYFCQLKTKPFSRR